MCADEISNDLVITSTYDIIESISYIRTCKVLRHSRTICKHLKENKSLMFPLVKGCMILESGYSKEGNNFLNYVLLAGPNCVNLHRISHRTEVNLPFVNIL